MAGFPQGAELEQRARTLAVELDKTLAADATILRDEYASAAPVSAELPLITLDAQLVAPPRTPPSTAGAPPDLQLLGILGSGGMGAVYAARQRALGRDVAVKRPLDRDASEQERLALLGEARVMGALEHPNIVPVHALGRDADGLPVLVMKRIEGVSWRSLMRDPEQALARHSIASPERGLAFHLDVLAQVANALAFAHSRGVIHRDVKPENVMIGSFGEVYLLDWGIALRSAGEASKQVVGTLAYMPPEMLIDPASVDARSDVFLLGATLHEALTGSPPHHGQTLEALLHSIMRCDAPSYPPSVPRDLAALATRAMARSPADRPADATAFRAALDTYRVHRASRELSASAAAVLSDVESRVARSKDELTTLEVGVRLAECRFGFAQSLREWPENPDARAGLDRCLSLAIRREVAARNAGAARVLLAELPVPDQALTELIYALEDELQAASARERAAKADAHERDASVSAVQRMLFYTAFGIVGLGVSIAGYLEEKRTGKPMSMDDQVQLDITVLSVLAVGILLGRRRLLANRYNRDLFLLWFTVCVGIAANDVLLRARGVDSWTATALDFFMLSATFTVGAIVIDRFLGILAAAGALAATVSAILPSYSTLAATLSLFVAIGVSVEHARRSAIRQR